MSIDFPTPIPDEDEREAIAEILSFVFGRRLMQVGSTLFDSAGWTIEEEVATPWGRTTADVFERGDMPPIPFSLRGAAGEDALGRLVQRYLQERKRLGLRDALLTYWVAGEAVAGVGIALYGSAVESLKSAWFDSLDSKSKGAHVDKSKYESLVGDLLTTARERLTAAGVAPAVGNKLGGVWRMGARESLEAFFDELVLPIGEAEKAAMAARNGPVHGGLKAGANVRKLVRHGNVYRTLFERTFLKLLGYSGNYIDRPALGHPAHPLDEPCLGTASAGASS
jgi:hypothetical protein